MRLDRGARPRRRPGPASRRGRRPPTPSSATSATGAQSAVWTAERRARGGGHRGVGLGARPASPGASTTVTTAAPCTWRSHVHGRSTSAGAARRARPGRRIDEVAVGRAWSKSHPGVTAPSNSTPRRRRRGVTGPPATSGTTGRRTRRRRRGRGRRRRRRRDHVDLVEDPTERRARLGPAASPPPARLVALVPAVEAGGDDGDPHLVAHLVVDDGAEDDVGVGVGDAVDDLGRLVDLEQAEVAAAGDGEQDAAGALDRGLEQRAGDGVAGRAAAPGPRPSRSRCP